VKASVAAVKTAVDTGRAMKSLPATEVAAAAYPTAAVHGMATTAVTSNMPTAAARETRHCGSSKQHDHDE